MIKFNVRGLLFKTMSYITLATLYYPLFAVTRAFFFGSQQGIIGFLVALLLMFSGVLTGVLLIKKTGHIFLWSLLAKLCVLAPILIMIAFYWHLGWVRVAAEIPFVLVFYFIGLKGLSRKYGDMLQAFQINFGIIITVGGLIAVNYVRHSEALRTLLFIFAFTALLLVLVLKNQFWLENFIAKHSGDTGLPKFLRIVNLIYVGVVFIIIVLCFNFKNIIVKIINVCGDVIKLLIRIVMKLILLLTPEMQKVPQGTQNQPTLPPVEETGSSWFAIILNILAYAIFIIIIFFVLKLAIKKVILLLSKILDKLKKVSESENSEFIDEIEKIDATTSVRKKKKLDKSFKKMKKELSHISDPVMKVRFLYKMVLFLLANKEIDIQSADTTGEIYKKACSVNKLDGFADLTEVYDEVRYGDVVPDEIKVNMVENRYCELDKRLK